MVLTPSNVKEVHIVSKGFGLCAIHFWQVHKQNLYQHLGDKHKVKML